MSKIFYNFARLSRGTGGDSITPPMFVHSVFNIDSSSDINITFRCTVYRTQIKGKPYSANSRAEELRSLNLPSAVHPVLSHAATTNVAWATAITGKSTSFYNTIATVKVTANAMIFASTTIVPWGSLILATVLILLL